MMSWGIKKVKVTEQQFFSSSSSTASLSGFLCSPEHMCKTYVFLSPIVGHGSTESDERGSAWLGEEDPKTIPVNGHPRHLNMNNTISHMYRSFGNK